MDILRYNWAMPQITTRKTPKSVVQSALEDPPVVITVAVVAFEGISPFHLSVPCMVFGEDRSELGVPPFNTLVCATRIGSLSTSVGFNIEVQHGLEALQKAHIVIVPSWHDANLRPPEELLNALRHAHQRGARMVGLCLGAFVLAEAGLLDGKIATTHWSWAQAFSSRYPKVRLDPDVLYIDNGGILTSAGTAASIDCCLFLLRQLCGAEAANRVARRLVVAPHRQGGQAQFIEQPLPASRQDDRLAQVFEWLGQNLGRTHSVDALAERAVMSRRTFTRHFRQATGTTVVQWLLHQRLAVAQRLLESSDCSIEIIAAASGFGSALSLRQRFNAAFNTTPSAYRRQFQGGNG
jgi:transcriptional regulator GlxA family with amidase domain